MRPAKDYIRRWEMENQDAKLIAEGMVKSAEKIANAIIDNNTKNANAIIDSNTKNANAIIYNSTKNAEALRDGFKEVGKSLGGTKAELMMDVLLKQANGGDLPEPGSDEWNKCRDISKKVLEEFQ
jgi:hypothetical protein